MENLGQYDSGVPFRKFIFVFLLVCVIVGTGVVYSALSKATVTVIPRSTIKEINTEVTIDGNLSYPDLDKGILSGEIKTREAEGQDKGVEVLNKKIEEFAKGRVIIRNNTPYTQGIKQGAGLKPVGAPEGVTFITTERALLGPKQSKEVGIIATFKGAKGNLPPGKFELLNLDTKYMQDNIWAESKDKTDGGIREAKIVTQEDLDRAYATLGKKMFQKTLEEINKGLGPDKIVKEESATYTINEKNSSVLVNSEVDFFDVSLKILVQGVTISENDLQTVAEKKIKNLGESYEEFVKEEPGSFSYQLTQLNMDEKKAVMKVSVKGDFRAKLSPKVFDKKSIAGYNQAALEEHFSKFDNVSGIKVHFWPSFRKTVPNMENRIDISVETE